jgi:hypothetical protein
MNDFMEQLESRTLMSTSYPAAGTYKGTATPQGKGSTAAILAAVGATKGSATLAASLVLTIADNDIVTGSLTLTYAKTTATVGTYALSGLVTGTDVNITIESTGKAVGTFDGALKSGDKRLTGPFTDTLNGQPIKGELNLINSQVKPKGGGGKQSTALVPGYTPNETPPTITTGTGNGDPTGITGGDNSGTGTISDGGGSILG